MNTYKAIISETETTFYEVTIAAENEKDAREFAKQHEIDPKIDKPFSNKYFPAKVELVYNEKMQEKK